jgi:hypothetical protein
VTVAIAVVAAVSARRAYVIIAVWERQDFFLDLDESANCRLSSNEAAVETFGGESNSAGVITGLALGGQQLLHEILVRFKTYKLVPATKVELAVGLKPELGSRLMVATFMRQTGRWLRRSDLADAAADLPPNGSEGLVRGEGLELRAFSGQGAEVRHEDWAR